MGVVVLAATGAVAVASSSAAADPLPVVVTASDASMRYGGDLPTVEPSYSGLPDGSDATDLVAAPTCTAHPVSGHTSCAGAVDPRYAFTYVTGSLAVEPTALTVLASDEEWEMSDELPVPTPSYDGLVAGDSGPATPPVCVADEATWRTSCSGAADPHYSIRYVDGRLSGFLLGPEPLAPTEGGGADPAGPVVAAPTGVRAPAPIAVLPSTGR